VVKDADPNITSEVSKLMISYSHIVSTQSSDRGRYSDGTYPVATGVKDDRRWPGRNDWQGACLFLMSVVF
jgi:hypothetical protein